MKKLVVRLIESYGYEPIAPEAHITTVKAASSLSRKQYESLSTPQQKEVVKVAYAQDIFTKQGYTPREIEEVLIKDKAPELAFTIQPIVTDAEKQLQESLSFLEKTKAAWQKGMESLREKFTTPATEGGITTPSDIVESWTDAFSNLKGGAAEVISHLPLIPDYHYDADTQELTKAPSELGFFDKVGIGAGVIVLGLGALFILTRKQ